MTPGVGGGGQVPEMAFRHPPLLSMMMVSRERKMKLVGTKKEVMMMMMMNMNSVVVVDTHPVAVDHHLPSGCQRLRTASGGSFEY